MSAQLQLEHLSLQVLDAGVLEDGMEKALCLPASPFTERSPLPAPGVYPPRHQETTVQGDHPWASQRRWDNVNVVFEISYCFLQAFFQLGISLKLGTP